MSSTESFSNRTSPEPRPEGRARWLRLLVLTGLIVAVGQLIDPVASAGLLESTIFWALRIAAFAISVVAAHLIVDRVPARRWQRPAWLRQAVLPMLVAIVPFAFVELALEQWIPPAEEFDDSEWLAASPVAALLSEYLTIVSVLVPLNLLLWALIDNRAVAAAPEMREEPKPLPAPAFLAKTELPRAAGVLALEADEHYVRVHTADNTHLIHHRLRDAIEEMPEELGLQVHRSWWVAVDAVSAVQKKRRRRILVLSNGLQVPVSDSFRERARARGILH